MNIDDYILNNPVIRGFKRKPILRKFYTFVFLSSVCVFLFVGAIISPDRVTYSKEQLATTREFPNNSGQIKLKNQTYSKKTGILLLELETSDYTSPIKKGIFAGNLKWDLYTKFDSKDTTMEIIPLTNNKIFLVIKNVPEDFDILAIQIQNQTPTNQSTDIAIKDFETEQSREESIFKNESPSEAEDADTVQLFVTTQGDQLKYKELKDLSREEFVLSVFEEEKTFQEKQITELTGKIETLNAAVEEGKQTLATLQQEGQYMVGKNLEQNQSDIDRVKTDIDVKESQVEQANDNIKLIQNTVDNLNRNIKKVKDGTYQFNAPVISVRKDI